MFTDALNMSIYSITRTWLLIHFYQKGRFIYRAVQKVQKNEPFNFVTCSIHRTAIMCMCYKLLSPKLNVAMNTHYGMQPSYEPSKRSIIIINRQFLVHRNTETISRVRMPVVTSFSECSWVTCKHFKGRLKSIYCLRCILKCGWTVVHTGKLSRK